MKTTTTAPKMAYMPADMVAGIEDMLAAAFYAMDTNQIKSAVSELDAYVKYTFSGVYTTPTALETALSQRIEEQREKAILRALCEANELLKVSNANCSVKAGNAVDITQLGVGIPGYIVRENQYRWVFDARNKITQKFLAKIKTQPVNA
jgi:hypothetical protein